MSSHSSRSWKKIKCFSDTTGLSSNQNKFNIVVSSVSENLKATLLEITGFWISELPIRFLGLPLAHKK